MKNNNLATLDYLNKMLIPIPNKQFGIKELDICLTTFENIISYPAPLDTLYQTFLNMFITAAPAIKARQEKIYAIFYNLVRLNEQNFAKMYSLVKNLIDIGQKRQTQLQNPKFNGFLKSYLSLLRKASQKQKQWGANIVPIFIRHYLQKLQDYYVLKKPICLHHLLEISQSLTTKYKYQTTVFVNTLKQSHAGKLPFLKLYLLLQISNNPAFILTILKQPQFTQSIGPINLTTISGIKESEIMSLYLKGFGKFIEENPLQDVVYMAMLFPCPKAQKYNFQDVLNKVLLWGYLNNKYKQPIPIKAQKQQTVIEQLQQKLRACLNKKRSDNEISMWIKLSVLIYGYFLKKNKILIMVQQQLNNKQNNHNKIFRDCLEIIDLYEEQITIAKRVGTIYKAKLQQPDDAKIKEVKQYLYQSQQNTQNNTKMELQLSMPKLQNLTQPEISDLLFMIIKQVKIHTQAMNINKNNQKQQQVKQFPQLSYQLFQLANIIIKQELSKPIKQNQLTLDQFSSRAWNILNILIQKYGINLLYPLLKKHVQHIYDKINQYSLKKIMVNGFVVRVLYLSGTKIKNLSELILYRQEYLHHPIIKSLFKRADQVGILKLYLSYLSTKDKIKFKLEVFEHLQARGPLSEKLIKTVDYLLTEPIWKIVQ